MGQKSHSHKTRARPQAGRLAAQPGSFLTAATRVDATPRTCRGPGHTAPSWEAALRPSRLSRALHATCVFIYGLAHPSDGFGHHVKGDPSQLGDRQ